MLLGKLGPAPIGPAVDQLQQIVAEAPGRRQYSREPAMVRFTVRCASSMIFGPSPHKLEELFVRCLYYCCAEILLA